MKGKGERKSMRVSEIHVIYLYYKLHKVHVPTIKNVATELELPSLCIKKEALVMTPTQVAVQGYSPFSI